MKPSVSDRFSLGLVFVIALALAFVVGAWQGLHTPQAVSPVDAGTEPSVFVQSGGVAADRDAGLPDTAEALTQARAASKAAASTF